MKKLIVLSALLGTLLSTTAWAVELTKGTVKKLDEKQMKVTIKHEDLKNLGMPGMTMVFVVKDAEMIKKLQPGKNIEFMADRVNGQLTVVEVK